MKVLIVDYNGTLTDLVDPVGILTRMRERGWFVLMWSGVLPEIIERYNPGIMSQVDMFKDKLDQPYEFLPALQDIEEVLLCEDHRFVRESTLNWAKIARKEPWTSITLAQLIALSA